MCIPNQNYLIDALDTVLAWNLSDETFIDTINYQLKLIEGVSLDENWEP